MPWSVRRAKSLFEELSFKGSPMGPSLAFEKRRVGLVSVGAAGQSGLGFLHTAGLSVNSSQAKALVYWTFAALGGEPMAQMALVWSPLSEPKPVVANLPISRATATGRASTSRPTAKRRSRGTARSPKRLDYQTSHIAHMATAHP